MAEKKTASSKKSTSNAKASDKKVTTKKAETKKVSKPSTKSKAKGKVKAEDKKTTSKKVETKKVAVKNEVKPKEEKKETKKVKVVDTYEERLKEQKRENKFKSWFNRLTLEQLVIAGVIIIAGLLIILIGVSTKNTKTKNGDDIVVQVDGKTITANDLYKELKTQNGRNVAINMIDDYILNKEYKTTDDMKKSADSTIENYKSTYGDSYQSFLEYNGLSNDSQLKDLLIKNSKLTKVTDDYIKENITEKEMKKYYDDKIVGDVEAKHILVSFGYDDDASDEEKESAEKVAKEKAEEIIKKIKDGADFSELAKEYSDDDASKENGGSLGYFNTGEMVKEFEEAVYALDVNEYTTEPVKTTYGYHIIMKTGQKEKPSYNKSKDTIMEKLIEEKKEADSALSVKAMIALREKYKIKIKDKTIKSDYNTYIKEATTTTTTSSSK